MKYERVRSAYDSTLPGEEVKERMLQKLLDAASNPRPEGNVTTMKAIRKKRIIPIAAVLIIILSCTVAAHAGTLYGTFGLWLGWQKVELAELSPAAFDLDTFTECAEEVPTEDGVDHFMVFKDYADFTAKTGMVLTDSAEIELTDIWVDISDFFRTGHMGMDIVLDGEACRMNGMFVLEGNKEENYGYGVPARKVDDVYEYVEGRKAYFVNDDEITEVYFTENNVMYQLFVENSAEGKSLGKNVVNCMASIEAMD